MHDNNIMVRNINPEMMFFNRSNNTLIIYDLGSCSVNTASKEKIKTNLFFSSPEMVRYNDF